MIPILTGREVVGALTWEPVVSSWLGSQWLGDVPAVAGSVTWSSRREVPGSLDMRVPAWAPEHEGGPFRSWVPDTYDYDHPLAAMGQVLTVGVRVSTTLSLRSWIIPQGRFLISETAEDADGVQVQGLSLTQRIVGDRFPSPMSTRAGGTLASEARRLVPASMSLMIHPDLRDRDVPSMSWDESRIQSLSDLAKAWPARLREDMEGTIRFLPPLPDTVTPVLTLTDGEGGTVVSAYTSQSREGVYTSVVARGQDTDPERPAFQGEAIQQSGPYAADRYGLERRFFASPLLTSQDAAEKAARTVLADSIRPARTVPVVMASDPRIEVDDPIRIITDAGTPRQRERYGWVSGIQMPLTWRDPVMRVDVEGV